MGFWKNLFKKKSDERISFTVMSRCCHVAKEIPKKYLNSALMAAKFSSERLVINPEKQVSRRALNNAWIEWKKIPGNCLGETIVHGSCSSLLKGLNFINPGVFEIHRLSTGTHYHGIALR